MWEFGTTNPVSVQKSPQGAGVVTKIRFTPQGNKVSMLFQLNYTLQEAHWPLQQNNSIYNISKNLYIFTLKQ